MIIIKEICSIKGPRFPDFVMFVEAACPGCLLEEEEELKVGGKIVEKKCSLLSFGKDYKKRLFVFRCEGQLVGWCEKSSLLKEFVLYASSGVACR